MSVSGWLDCLTDIDDLDIDLPRNSSSTFSKPTKASLDTLSKLWFSPKFRTFNDFSAENGRLSSTVKSVLLISKLVRLSKPVIRAMVFINYSIMGEGVLQMKNLTLMLSR